MVKHKLFRRSNESRRSDPVTHALALAFSDRRYGTQNGKADAGGHPMADAEGVPHAERLIDAQAARAAADQSRDRVQKKEVAHHAREDAVLLKEQAEREAAQCDILDAEQAEREKSLGGRHGLGPVAYGLVLAALFGLTLPIDYTVASWLELPPVGQWLLTVFIGVVVMLAAHFSAKKIDELEESHAKREHQPFAFSRDWLAVGAALGVAMFVLVTTALWRGQILAAEAKTSEVPIPSWVVALALGGLAALAFVVALLAGMSFRRMAPLRTVLKERARLKADRARWQSAADRAARTAREAEVTLACQAQREPEELQAIRHWAEERKARLSQRAAWVAFRERRKAADWPDSRGLHSSDRPIPRRALTRHARPTD
jgi:hypothetical protein